MPDIRASNAPGNVTNDLKIRSTLEVEGGDNGQFLDVMIAKLSAAGSPEDTDAKATSKVSAADATHNSAYLDRLKSLRNADKADALTQIDATKADLNKKIKAKIAEMAKADETPVKDDRPLKALKKVAEFLLKAEEQGKIDLPPELAQKLEAYLAKGDDLTAIDVAEFMHDFIAVFKGLNVVLAAPVVKPVVDASVKPVAEAAAEPVLNADGTQAEVENTGEIVLEAETELVWPKELADAFKELKLGGLVLENQPVTPIQLLKAVKALVNSSEKAALSTLHDKAQSTILGQTDAEILVPKASVDKVAAILAGIVKPADASPEDVTKAIAETQAAIINAPLQIKPAKVELAARPKNAGDVLVPATDGELPDLLGLKADAPEAQLLPQNKDSRKSDALLRDLASQPNNPAPAQNAQNPASAIAAAIRSAQAYGPPEPRAADAVAAVNAETAVNNLDADTGPLSAPQHAGRFAKALNASTSANGAQPSTAAQQVMVQIQNRGSKSSQINIQLTPIELGRVDVRLNVGRDGQAYAVVMADSPETLSLLQKDASHLEKALQQAGLNASAENMSFNLREQRQQSGGFAGRKRLGRDDAISAPNADLALNVHSDGQIISDTRVNYHA